MKGPGPQQGRLPIEALDALDRWVEAYSTDRYDEGTQQAPTWARRRRGALALEGRKVPPRGGAPERRPVAVRSQRFLVFAYGSNLDPGQMRRRCPGAKAVGVGTLRGHRLVFRGTADVEMEKGASVRGVVWSLDRWDLVALDRCEGWPHVYTRNRRPIRMADGKVRQAWVYHMTDPDLRGLMLPGPDYFNRIVAGCRHWHLPTRPVTGAAEEAARWLVDQGVKRLVPDGRKRWKPAPAKGRR